MTYIADMKIALLAALIVLSAAICADQSDGLTKAQSHFAPAPLIETQVLNG